MRLELLSLNLWTCLLEENEHMTHMLNVFILCWAMEQDIVNVWGV
jgi:hypothetical protein